MSTYVYGVVAAEHPSKVAGLGGVGRPPSTVRVLNAGELRAIVSDAPPTLRAKRRDLLAHEEVLEALCEQGATLPMRFGLVADDDDSAARAVSAKQETYLDTLSTVAGRVEVNVKATHHEDAVLREVLADDEQLRGMNEDMRQRDGGTHQERLEFGERVANALQVRQQRDAEIILAPLRRHAVAESSAPAVDECFVNTSFLVDREQLSDFQDTLNEVAGALDSLMEIQMFGPLPAYSFTNNAAPQE